MADDPAKIAECRGWLDRVQADLISASVLLKADPPRTDTAIFHCQQAAEKALKAFLFWHDVLFRKTHNLRELGAACLQIDNSWMDLLEQAEGLTQFAWVFRYPGEPEAPSQAETEDALMVARAVYDAVLDRLPESVRP